MSTTEKSGECRIPQWSSVFVYSTLLFKAMNEQKNLAGTLKMYRF